MDTWGDVTGLIVVLVMIRVGWMLARAAWDELPGTQREVEIDLRTVDRHPR